MSWVLDYKDEQLINLDNAAAVRIDTWGQISFVCADMPNGKEYILFKGTKEQAQDYLRRIYGQKS